MKRSTAVVMVAALICVGLGGCASSNVDVKGFADSRERAVAANDEHAFMATIAAEAKPEFASAQQNWIHSALKIGIIEFNNEIKSVVSPTDDNGLAKDSRLVNLLTSYRIDGYEERPFVTSQWVTLQRSAGEWLAVASDDGAAVGLTSEVDFLSTAVVDVFRGERFLVLAPPGRRDRAREVAARAETARDALDGSGIDPPARMVLAVFESAVDADAVLGASVDSKSFVAFVSYRLDRSSGIAAVPRLYVQDENFVRTSAQSQEGTLVHELVHAALSDRATSVTPVWLHEGIAEWIRLGRPVSPSPWSGTKELPGDEEFRGANLAVAYRQSAAAVTYLASRHGVEAPVGLYRTIYEQSSMPGTPSYNLDRAFLASTGEDLAAFVAAWKGPQTV